MKEKLRPPVQYIILYMLLIMAGNPGIMLYKSSIFTIYKIILTVVALCALGAYKGIKINIPLKKIEYLILFCALISFSVLMNSNFSGISTLLSYYIFITLGMLLSEFFSPEEFRVCLVRVMLAVCVISLVFFLIQLAAPTLLFKCLVVDVKPNGMMTYKSNLFYNAILDNRFSTDTGSVAYFIRRNCGPFWEPGVFSCFIAMAMVCVLYDHQKEKYSGIKIGIFLVTFLSTVSVTGFLVLGILMVIYTIRNVRTFGLYIILAILGVLCIGIKMFDFILERVWDMIPYLSHRIGIQTLFENKNWLKSLLWGQGFGVSTSYNAYFNLFLMFGIVFIVIWFAKIRIGCKRVAGEFLFIALSLSLTSEPIGYNSIFWILVFYGCENKNSNQESIPERMDSINV